MTSTCQPGPSVPLPYSGFQGGDQVEAPGLPMSMSADFAGVGFQDRPMISTCHSTRRTDAELPFPP